MGKGDEKDRRPEPPENGYETRSSGDGRNLSVFLDNEDAQEESSSCSEKERSERGRDNEACRKMRQPRGAPQTETEEKKGKHGDLLVRLNGLREERGARSSAQSVEDGEKATVTVG